jgi:hypothetical protein
MIETNARVFLYEVRGSHSSIAMMTNKAKNAYDADPALRLLYKLKLNQNEKERN